MKANNDIFEKKPLDEILAALNILKITTDTQDFENWIKTYHKKELYSDIVQGYKFFIITAIRFLIHAIELDYSLGIEEDYIFFRGRFREIPIEDIPNTSEKTIFIKNIWSKTKPLRQARNWEDIKLSIKSLKPLTELFGQIYERSSPTIKINKDRALNEITTFYVFIFLNDTHRGIPYGYILPSTIEVSATLGYLKEVFKGYKLTLQYLWFKLLGEKNFSKSCLNEIHRAKDWDALDKFFKKIREEIIKPLEDKLELSLDLEPLLEIEDFDKNVLTKFLSKESIKEPEYLKKKNDDEIKKWLDYKLLWYNVEVLSSTGSIFSGVPAFVAILSGLVQLNKDSVMVKIFKHPSGKEKYNYSFGILIPSFSSTGIADYSGWLVFFDCATDYSGFGRSLYYQAKNFIDKFKENGVIEIEEIEIEKDIFKEYLKERSESSVFDRIINKTPFGEEIIDISKMEEENRDIKEKVKGILFELMIYKWVLRQRYYDEVEHNCLINGEEIDVFSKKGNKIYLFECKVAVHRDGLNKTIDQIKRKISAIKNKYPEHEIVPLLITYSPLDSERKKFFSKQGINVRDGVNKEIENLNLLSKDKVKLVKQIFES